MLFSENSPVEMEMKDKISGISDGQAAPLGRYIIYFCTTKKWKYFGELSTLCVEMGKHP